MTTQYKVVSTLPPQIMALLVPPNVAAGVINVRYTKEMRQDLRSRRVAQGMLSKTAVYYLPFSPMPPIAYVYDCSNCTFNRQANKSCELVAGNIEAYAWCALWMPKDDDKPFGWMTKAWK